MSPKTNSRMPDPDERARVFIDRIMQINRAHGMGDTVPEETYQRAVRGSAEVFKGLSPTHAGRSTVDAG